MDDTKMQAVADAAVAYLVPKLLVKASYVPAAPPNAVTIPRADYCPTCGSVIPGGYIAISSASLEQDPAMLIVTECKGMLDAIAGQLNMAGHPIVTHALDLPSGVSGKAISQKNGVALRAVTTFSINRNENVLRFDVQYSI